MVFHYGSEELEIFKKNNCVILIKSLPYPSYYRLDENNFNSVIRYPTRLSPLYIEVKACARITYLRLQFDGNWKFRNDV